VKAVEVLEQAKSTAFTNPQGGSWSLSLKPPGTEAEICRLETKLGLTLPLELRELISYCRGFEGVLANIDFVGNLEYEFDLLPHGLPIADDGCGNFWVIDLTKDAPETSSVFFASHDPPVLVYQADSIGQFITEALKRCIEPFTSDIEKVQERAAMQIWAENPNVLNREESLAGDPDLRAFAESLDNTYLFIDMRKATCGKGFSWGRYGAETQTKRFGEKRIFAYQKRELSWLQKIFGV
jgi:hypothetical protein